MMAKWFGLLSLSMLALGCGGRTEEGGEPPSSNEPPAATPEEEGAGEGPDKDPDGSTLLPGCEKGFDPKEEPYRTCNWVAKGYCYEEKLEACACVCPRDTSVASHCASGFPVENGRVEVYCY